MKASMKIVAAVAFFQPSTMGGATSVLQKMVRWRAEGISREIGLNLKKAPAPLEGLRQAIPRKTVCPQMIS